jgi:hypothetical protein
MHHYTKLRLIAVAVAIAGVVLAVIMFAGIHPAPTPPAGGYGSGDII